MTGLIALAGTSVVLAQDDQGRGNAPPSRERGAQRAEDRGHRSSMSDSVRRVRNETGGQVLSVERMQYDGREINRVKYVDDRGRVRTMDDAGPSRRGADAPSRPRDGSQPARGDNPPRP
ncbi:MULTISPECIES: hypothetical protein [unclassified Pseudoxanthomonas]|uniref:hypothetical protein n=1 Tax=unclassified Pseudoxanthomonas TaxID=2645906 RepID=UPI0008E1C985|nr:MULTISPECIES: hypothetical protein [unclassified Pseudoxanthomonas]PPJ41454.1 hypothetical protein C0063_16605 [Pseudoxanthomonas sp. KAs_5_3]SFV30257.1 hypothetical protein SAMN05428990_1573 [Pseudoxanthomonas sp. YR558]